MRVLVCGDRAWSDRAPIERELRGLPEGTVVIHGGCRGADRLAGQVASELSFGVEEFPAEWHRYGRAAGPIRNRRMLEEGKPDLVLAFHPDLSRSRGTRDMVDRARKAGVEVRVFSG